MLLSWFRYEQGLAALSIEKAEELAAAITQLRSEYERRDEKKSRTYAHVLKRNKLQLRSETHHLREENSRLRDQIKEALRVIDRNAAMLVASSTALRDAQRTGARSSILDDSIGLDDALDDGPQFAWLEQVGTETLAESAAHLGQRGHHGNVDSGGSDALSDIEMQALYTRVRSTIVRKDSIIDQLKSKYREVILPAPPQNTFPARSTKCVHEKVWTALRGWFERFCVPALLQWCAHSYAIPVL